MSDPAISWTGRVHALVVADVDSAPTRLVDAVEVTAGVGVAGDRYGTEPRPAPEQLTLIELEAIQAANAAYGLSLSEADPRRQVVTEGVPLNHLVAREFTVGGIRVRGVELCEPCGHLQQLTGQKVVKALRHRGGLRAQVLSSGRIQAGDPVRPA